MLSEISSRELTEWLAFYQVEPFGDSETQAEYRMAYLAALLANIHRDTKKHPSEFTAREFMRTEFLRAGEEPAADALLEKAKTIFGALNRKGKEKGG